MSGRDVMIVCSFSRRSRPQLFESAADRARVFLRFLIVP
jgi:hypothetical protein